MISIVIDFKEFMHFGEGELFILWMCGLVLRIWFWLVHIPDSSNESIDNTEGGMVML